MFFWNLKKNEKYVFLNTVCNSDQNFDCIFLFTVFNNQITSFISHDRSKCWIRTQLQKNSIFKKVQNKQKIKANNTILCVCMRAFADVSACVTMCLDGCQCWIFSSAVPARLPYPPYYYFAPIGKRSIVMMTASVSVCVCLSVREHISGNTRPIST